MLRLCQMKKTISQQTDFINAAEAVSLPGLFAARVQRSPDSIAYQQYDAQTDSWRDYRWQDMHALVARWRAALANEKLQVGDRVATLVSNGIDWVCFEQAAQSLGLVVVALYTTDTPTNLSYILADAGVRVLLIEELEQWQSLAGKQQELSALQRVWCLRKSETTAEQTQHLDYIEDVLPLEGPGYENVETDPRGLATIIYTSGTTGRPKGVMLSHRNILTNAEAVHINIPAYPEDIFISFLPLAHGFERTVNYYLPMMAGSRVSYARSIKLLAEDLLVIRPTVFLSAPRLYEKIYAAVQAKVAPHAMKRKLLAAAVSLGWQQFEARQGRRRSLNPLQHVLYRLLHKLVAEKILARLGGRLRVAVTGAAPLSEKVARFFVGLGFPLVEGYGLTEAGPVVSGNSLEINTPGSVGRPLPGIEVATTEEGELLVRSPGVMLGYWQREEATREVIDDVGWLHTGDLAEIKGENIFIRGRRKDILVTSTGEKVAPADMEMTITLDPLFEQAMVIGEGKPYISALLVLNPRAWQKLAGELGLDAQDVNSLQSAQASEAVLARLATLLDMFPGYTQIRAVHLSCEPWSIENGLLTPTMKIKRSELEKRFAQEISELYRGHLMVD
jgi:long-chain acyl-CoA synthetase